MLVTGANFKYRILVSFVVSSRLTGDCMDSVLMVHGQVSLVSVEFGFVIGKPMLQYLVHRLLTSIY